MANGLLSHSHSMLSRMWAVGLVGLMVAPSLTPLSAFNQTAFFQRAARQSISSPIGSQRFHSSMGDRAVSHLVPIVRTTLRFKSASSSGGSNPHAEPVRPRLHQRFAAISFIKAPRVLPLRM